MAATARGFSDSVDSFHPFRILVFSLFVSWPLLIRDRTDNEKAEGRWCSNLVLTIISGESSQCCSGTTSHVAGPRLIFPEGQDSLRIIDHDRKAVSREATVVNTGTEIWWPLNLIEALLYCLSRVLLGWLKLWRDGWSRWVYRYKLLLRQLAETALI